MNESSFIISRYVRGSLEYFGCCNMNVPHIYRNREFISDKDITLCAREQHFGNFVIKSTIVNRATT